MAPDSPEEEGKCRGLRRLSESNNRAVSIYYYIVDYLLSDCAADNMYAIITAPGGATRRRHSRVATGCAAIATE
jgi:hypothetical protein